ncbi:nuclear transport factor 2 family protein [Gemmata sp. JC717]|uniref:nuclear transport factor 2 family protein n=1 Tax=Gemmata algarum TaxID=2975278 RepID=UPI0021BAA8CA|nr:nuclear transport factor 2 family protein [Gemmata algarum]MDY3554540.1 nuclear transport factor 2 family protein [Gemmata algarum]
MLASDYEQLMQSNLAAVFSEADPSARMQAIEALYSAAPTLYEPGGVVQGRQAISDTVGRLLASLPTGFAFTVAGPTVGHHDVCCVRWRGGPRDGSALITGSDVAQIEDGKIRALYVFIDPAPH